MYVDVMTLPKKKGEQKIFTRLKIMESISEDTSISYLIVQKKVLEYTKVLCNQRVKYPKSEKNKTFISFGPRNLFWYSKRWKRKRKKVTKSELIISKRCNPKKGNLLLQVSIDYLVTKNP